MWLDLIFKRKTIGLAVCMEAKIFVIRPEIFIDLLKNNREFGGYFDKMPSLYESYDVIKSYLSSYKIPSSVDHNYILALASRSNGMGVPKENYTSIQKDRKYKYIVSSSFNPEFQVGQLINSTYSFDAKFSIPTRFQN